MPKIIINEEDLTNPIITSDTTDIAYIPGFAETDPSDSTYTLGEPQLVTELDDFVARFGEKPFAFDETDAVSPWSASHVYSIFDVVTNGGVYYCSTGSDNDSVPGETLNTWYSAGSVVNEYSAGTYSKYSLIFMDDSGTTTYYVSTEDNNTTAPTDSDAKWISVGETIESFDVEETYDKYDAVTSVVDGQTIYFVSTVSSNTSSPSAEYPTWRTNTASLPPAEWNAAVSYVEYAMVSHEGSVYSSKVDGNLGYTPSINSDKWNYIGTAVSKGKYDAFGIDLDCDIAYVYATELLKLGLPIYYEVVANGDTKCDSVESFYSKLPTIFAKLEEKGSYYIKYITSGGYPVVKDTTTNGIIKAMLDCAATRGDAIALIDHKEGMPVNREISGSAWNTVNNMAEGTYDKFIDDDLIDIGSYGAMLTPWEEHTFVRPYTVNDENVYTFTLPASFDYLTCLATSIKNNPSWVAVAGVQRASLPYDNKRIKQLPKITNSVADSYMTYGKGETPNGRSINAITDIRNYGLTIWGNRTLLNNDNTRDIGAFGYLNIRNLACDVKKVVYAAAQRFMFEQNNDILWLNFTSAITPLLDKMATGGGISGYKIIKEKCNKKAKLKATVVLYPIYAVEEFEVTIQMRNEDVVVE